MLHLPQTASETNMPSITITHYKDAKNPMQIDQKDDALPGCHVE
jgi:hypothetical protein